MLGKITTDPPYLTIDNFEDCLSSDDVLVHFFNDFLSLPSFPECVQYNQETGVFEVVSDAAVALSRRIRSALQYFKSQPLTDPTELTARPVVDNHYTVLCLDREQGVEWILKERLPLFIESDCYFEYRLAKLLSQWGPQGWNQTRDGTSVQPPVTTEPVCPSPGPDDRETPMKVLYVSLGQASVTDMLTMAKDKDKQLPVCTQSVRTPVCSLGREGQRGPASACFSCIPDSESYALSSSLLVSFPLCSSLPDCPLCSSLLDWDKRRGDHSAEQEMKVYLTETEAKTEIEAGTTDEDNGDPKPQSPVCSTTDDETVGPHTESPFEGGPATSHSRLKEQQEEGDLEFHDLEFYDVTASIHGDRQGLGDFKDFLKGTLGEKLLRLWMDIERLKTLQDDRRRIRHLVQMRSCYLLTGGQSSLNGELLTRLGLSTSPCWREDRLQRVQPHVTEALLCYWGPRFRMSRRAVDPLRLSLRRNGQLHPPSGVNPNPRYINLHPLRAHTSIPRPTIRPDTSLPRGRTPTPAHTQTGYASSSPVVAPWRMERMLQALCVDSQAGFYFTRYCERSGNPLWENAVHCWCDLQQYHQLFYQDGLDPYRVQRQAHLLYSTYVCSAACSSIGVEEESRERVYTGLTPPFEELFDWVEEHTLTLLLEPWTLLTTRDTDTFQKVAVREETRQVESEPYGELKTLYEEAVHRLEQHAVAQACRPPPPPLEVARSPAMWSAVPERYRGYRLGSLLGHRTELQHFTSFLQDNTASIHLACWQDIENYRRIPHKDKAQREDKSRLIKDKYLNRKYFFGPDSPATRQQQEEVMRLAGGWGRLLHDRLCAPVLVDIQSIIRSHIETRWLPVFLTTPEFNERQQQRVRPRGEDRVSDHVYQRHRNKREVWKQVKGTWMTSAGEILAVRSALLNPVTCHQFRRFVSLKGDFLENDILFWLEVQRYKDLCHSHCVEAVVQDKVSTIISCFIQSSVPPALQIDIPPEQATHILERRREMGPYVFREAQMCVFSELLKLWPEFLSFSSGVQEEEVLPLNKQSAKLQRRRRREEEKEVERRAQEEVERFPEEHEEKHKGLQESRELLYPNSSSAHSLRSKSSRHSRQSQHQTQQRTEPTPGQSQHQTLQRTEPTPGQSQHQTLQRTEPTPGQSQHQTQQRTEPTPGQSQHQTQQRTEPTPGQSQHQTQQRTEPTPDPAEDRVNTRPNRGQSQHQDRANTRPNRGQSQHQTQQRTEPTPDPAEDRANTRPSRGQSQHQTQQSSNVSPRTEPTPDPAEF
uniref:regulator of G-protein signaling 22-like n=1 Tax=Oncorhynchus gorbuscha TaxID=8017 RepID=UPI001EAE9354|nr:regulator of G-protein signaling 22-like [Oncorhynchus gorbuscha]